MANRRFALGHNIGSLALQSDPMKSLVYVMAFTDCDTIYTNQGNQ